LVELLNPITDSVVLDVGCGTGNFLLELNSLSQKLVGLDLSTGMLAQAKSKSRAMLIRGNALFMPFYEKVFDAAYCIQVLHHILDKSRFINEVYRVLKREGRFVIQSCSHDQLKTFWQYHYFPTALEIDKKRIPDFREIADMLAQAGFKNISIHTCPFEVVFRNRKEPELFLDKRYRDGWSVFSLLSSQEIEEGCEKIKDDVRSGRAAKVVATFHQKAEQIGGHVSFIRSIKP
jgi:ubiquinone/menaquinone biosynthesis C-methylase UbiE